MDAGALLSHLRRRFVKLARNTKSPIARPAVRHIAQPRHRRHGTRLIAGHPGRAERSLPGSALSLGSKQLSISSGSTLAGHHATITGKADPLPRGASGATQPISAIRPVCLTRKNALFAGHEVGAENWALLASIVATCKLNDVNPAAYIAETLEAIIDGHPQSRIEDLMPWRFRKASTLRP
jgi:hypothetical protein